MLLPTICLVFCLIVKGTSGQGPPASIIVCKADVVICVDNSGSIRDNDPPGGDNWLLITNFVQALVSILNVSPDGAHVSVVDFGNKGYIKWNLTKYTTSDDVNKAVAAMPYRGENTNMTGGLYMARQVLTNTANGARLNVAKVIILITDGVPTFDADKLPEEVALDKSIPARIVTVGITNLINVTLLKSMASTPADYVYGGDYSGLDMIKNTVK